MINQHLLYNSQGCNILTFMISITGTQLRSPVLTAIGLVNGNPSFLTLTESTSLNLSLNNLSQVITSTTSIAVQNLVEIPPWGLLGK